MKLLNGQELAGYMRFAYEDKPAVFPHRAGRGVNPTLGLLFFPYSMEGLLK